jgi:DNA-binding HxlR family transcriptional regulator
MASPIFIGRWTPKILFSLRDGPCRHGRLRRQLGKRVAAHADQNSPQSRIRGLIARRVTQSKAMTVEYSLTKIGKDDHRSTQRHVPLGETLQPQRERRREASRSSIGGFNLGVSI